MRLSIAATCVVLTALIAGASASADPPAGHPGPPSIAAGPAFGYVPSQDASHGNRGGGGGGGKHVNLLQYHGGPVQSTGSSAYAIYWGPAWGGSYAATVSGLDTFYSGVGGSAYAKTNTEYTDGSGAHASSAIAFNGDLFDSNAAPSGAPSTSQVLAEVAKMTSNNPVPGAYYPVYSDQPRGTAGYCAWHSAGTINGVPVQFAFFFSLYNDSGCDPGDTATGHSEQLAALGNVSGHELSEMVTDPRLNAWYDKQGQENADRCAWTFSGTVNLGGTDWKIQGNWSNAAATTNSGYGGTVGCIETSTSPY